MVTNRLKKLIENAKKKENKLFFSSFDKTFAELSDAQLKQIIYPSSDIETPFGKKKVIYADFIASGKPCPLIEKYIAQNIYTKYSNTHSNSNYGMYMKNEIKKVRETIKEEYGLDDRYEILFKGSGVTDCVNYMIQCLDYSQYTETHVFISSYEHYSNHLPWVELSKMNKHVFLHIIPLTKQNEIDLVWFSNKIEDIYASSKKTLILTSVVHSSNLTGYFAPIYEIKCILNEFEKSNITQFLFCDLACSAPYIHENLSYLDAFVLSPHKFIGGVETPGVLVAKTCLFQKDHSIHPGGSCIKNTHKNKIVYSDDIEIRESAGTPNIIGIIKIGQCFLLKRKCFDRIEHNERCLSKLVQKWNAYFSKKYPRIFKYVPYEEDVDKLPIFSFHVKDLHFNFVVVLLNDIFGIQTRGGKACTGLFNDYVKTKYGMEGFCRISLHWTMKIKDIHFIFNACDFVFRYGKEFLQYYELNEKQQLFHYRTNVM